MTSSTLYSSELKYNITLNSAHSGQLAYKVFALVICGALILLSSYESYLTIISLLGITVVVTDVFLNQKPKITTRTLCIELSGQIRLLEEQKTYQLLSTSRLGFVGCWLVMTDINSTEMSNLSHNPCTNLQIFIFKSQLSDQDFSAIARVIAQL